MTLRVGIISAAWGVSAHLPAWRLVPGVEVAAICTAHRGTAQAAAAEHGIPLPFWDAGEMARHTDIDIVDVGTRPSYRRDMCLAALRAGKHVYAGVPLAADLDAARDLHDAAARAGTVAVVDAYSEHFASFRFARELLADGALGTVQSVVGRLEVSLFAPARSTFPYNWFHDPTYGASALRNLGAHLLHLMVFLCGPVAEVAGVPARFADRWDFVDGEGGLEVGVADTAVAALRFESGPIGTLTTAWAGAAAPGFHLEVAGDRGRILFRSPGMPAGDGTILLGRAGRELEPVPVPDRLLSTGPLAIPEAMLGNAREGMARSFLRMSEAIDGGGEAHPDFATAFHVASVIDAVHRSGEGAGWVRPSAAGEEAARR